MAIIEITCRQCLDAKGSVDRRTVSWVNSFGSYAEINEDIAGVRVLIDGEMPPYMTETFEGLDTGWQIQVLREQPELLGKHVDGTPDDIRPSQATLNRLLSALTAGRANIEQKPNDAQLPPGVNATAADLLRGRGGAPGERVTGEEIEEHKAAPQWPEPMAEEAFHGVFGDIVRIIEPETEADPCALLIHLLAAFGNACGRGPYVQVENSFHPPQLFAVLVGGTSAARKGTAGDRARAVLALADPTWNLERVRDGGMSSAEGLLEQIRDEVTATDENGKTKIVSEGVRDKRLLVIEPEFAAVLQQSQRPGNTLSAVLRTLWDKGTVGKMTKHSPSRTTNSLVSVVGHITPEELVRNLDRTEIANGFANRFLFICVRRSKLLPFGGENLDISILGTMLKPRLEWVRDIGARRVLWTDPARQLWVENYERLTLPRAGMLGALSARGAPQTLRLALIYALAERSNFIERHHLEAGLAVWRYAEASIEFLFGGVVGDEIADTILRALRAAPDGLTRSDIRDLFHGHQASNALSRALNELARHGLARKQESKTGGRPVERWSALR